MFSKSFPTFQEFFDNMHKIVNKLQDKNECSEKSKPPPKQNSVVSTFPENENAINTVKSHSVKFDNAKQKDCLFVGLLCISLVCVLYISQ